jgi:hypothetical protein
MRYACDRARGNCGSLSALQEGNDIRYRMYLI